MPDEKNISNSDYIASVAGSVNFDNISKEDSRLKISIGNFVDTNDVDIDEAELGPDEVDKLFADMQTVLSSPTRSKMPPEHREDLEYILDGLHTQITKSDQNNKQILRRFLQFLDDRAPEISNLVLEAINKT